jgi:hypothetical protein
MTAREPIYQNAGAIALSESTPRYRRTPIHQLPSQ